MALDLQRTARRRMRIVLMVAAGLVVLAAGVVVGVIAGSSGGDDNSAGPGPEASSSPGGEETDSGGEPEPGPSRTVEMPDDYTAPDEWVRLPAPTGETEGLPTGWPQTPEGAVAMFAEVTRNNWSFEEEEIARGMRVYTRAEDLDGLLATAGPSAEAVREYVGVPTSGPVPEDATVLATVIGVQWEELADDHVRISSLIQMVHTAGGGDDTDTLLMSTTGDAVWEDGEWKGAAVSEEVAQSAPDVAFLGSAEFTELGWIAIQEGDVR